MLSWSAERKLLYLIGTLAVLFVLIYVPFLLFWHEPATCTDGLKNGDETGIDCGGSCSQICTTDAVAPIVLWTRTFRVVPGVYNAVAYIENPNPNSEAPYAEYEFTFYDAQGERIASRTGSTFIPHGRRFGVFEGIFDFGTTTPARATFSFTRIPNWRDGTFISSDIVVRNKALLREETAPRIEAMITNQSNEYISQADLVAIVYDALGKAVATSRTIVEDLSPGDSERVTFSWPMPFETSVSVCSSPVDVALVIDRSGSMEDDGTDPPEPLTSVKSAARVFVDELTDEDRVAVVSFASDATLHTKSVNMLSQSAAQSAIDNISIVASTSAYTHIATGLRTAHDFITTLPPRNDARKAIVLLTDGVPTSPLEESDPEADARNIANSIADTDVSLYAIGLGTGVNREFLESLVTDAASYHGAPQANDLNAIYTSLATELCAKKPAVIEIIPRVIPNIY